MATSESATQNITVCLSRRTLRKAKILAAAAALALLDQGFHLGGRIEATRDEWHER